ncbi:MAG: MBL fold metallo-hydrolase [Candidatus Bathyarchaeia archaeon]
MYSRELNEFTYLIDLKPMGIESFIATYVLKGSKIAMVETGPTSSVKNLLAGLREMGMRTKEIDYVAVSHVHMDHAGGAGTLLRHLPNARLLVHARGAPHLVKPEKIWRQAKQVLGEIAEMYGEIQPVPKERIIAATDGMVIDLGEGIELKVLETLGHASHHLSFHESLGGGIFPGDAAGIYLNKFNVVIPTTPAPFHLEMALSSLDKLIKMAPKTLYYTHFGQASDTIKRMRGHAAQLKLWAKIVLEGMKDGVDMETIHERILEEDPSMKAIADFVKDHLVLRRGVVMQNIRGFIEYFRKIPKQ